MKGRVMRRSRSVGTAVSDGLDSTSNGAKVCYHWHSSHTNTHSLNND